MIRFFEHSSDICWQYVVKQDTLKEDLERYSNEVLSCKISDFDFFYVPKDYKEMCSEVTKFIERYEWLGKMPVWVTHRFIATYKNLIVGAVVFSTPNAFSYLLGKSNKSLEKLISRGATISFAPKNTGSWLIMKSIRWMVDHTDFRLFTAYADPAAGELGTIYQACNFIYLGQNYGGSKMYHYDGVGWVGSSYFSQRSVIKKIAIKAGVSWRPEYIKYNKTRRKRIIAWENMGDETKQFVRREVNKQKLSCRTIDSPPKHKYAYILGRTKAETRKLNSIFRTKNPDLIGLPYPKNRGI